MQHRQSIDDRPAPRSARPGQAACGWRMALAALLVAGTGSIATAAESISGLGPAFRPQGWAEAPVEQKRGPDTAGLPGLRVVVVSTAARSTATIDGQLVRVGSIVNNMRVTRIDGQGVTLVGNEGAREWLKVSPAVVKRPRPAPQPKQRVSSGDHP